MSKREREERTRERKADEKEDKKKKRVKKGKMPKREDIKKELVKVSDFTPEEVEIMGWSSTYKAYSLIVRYKEKGVEDSCLQMGINHSGVKLRKFLDG